MLTVVKTITFQATWAHVLLMSALDKWICFDDNTAIFKVKEDMPFPDQIWIWKRTRMYS